MKRITSFFRTARSTELRDDAARRKSARRQRSLSSCSRAASSSRLSRSVTKQTAAPNTLRQAITISNNTPSTPSNPNVINFQRPRNIARIDLQSPLPAITQPVIIDGTTEGSYNGAHPFVQLIGNYAGGSAIGLDITASGTQVKGLAIDGFNSGGVLIDNASNVTLSNDWVGLDPNANATGPDANGNTIYEGNGTYGVTIQSENGGHLQRGPPLQRHRLGQLLQRHHPLGRGHHPERGQRHDHRLGQHRRGRRGRPGQPAGQRPARRRRQRRRDQRRGVLQHHRRDHGQRRDVILGNKSYGVYITGTATDYNVIEGDVIGTDITGLHATDGAGGPTATASAAWPSTPGRRQLRHRHPLGPRGHLEQRRRRRPDQRQRTTTTMSTASTSAPTSTARTPCPTPATAWPSIPGAIGNYVGFVGFTPEYHLGQRGQRRQPRREWIPTRTSS